MSTHPSGEWRHWEAHPVYGYRIWCDDTENPGPTDCVLWLEYRKEKELEAEGQLNMLDDEAPAGPDTKKGASPSAGPARR